MDCYFYTCRSIAEYRSLISKGAVGFQIKDEELAHITKLDVDSSLSMMKDMQSSWQALRDQRK